MDEHERYLFDVNGYLVARGALPAELVARLNEQIDERIRRHRDANAPQLAFDHALDWRGPMLELIDNPRLRPYLEALFGGEIGGAVGGEADGAPRYRLDHTYVTVIRPGAASAGAWYLHGGNAPFDPGQFYRVSEGRMYNGLVVVAYNLAEVGADDGGFGCVPGSHKASFRVPRGWTDLREPSPIARAVTAPAGSAVIFTEALSHGTLPWRGLHERRTIFFKFNAFCTAHSDRYLDGECAGWPELDERQRLILERPYAPGVRRRRALQTA